MIYRIKHNGNTIAELSEQTLPIRPLPGDQLFISGTQAIYGVQHCAILMDMQEPDLSRRVVVLVFVGLLDPEHPAGPFYNTISILSKESFN